tara:strand:+ start:1241 stop:1927 length:687 start_codon:yes stop_codon:yes gene_type:complete
MTNYKLQRRKNNYDNRKNNYENMKNRNCKEKEKKEYSKTYYIGTHKRSSLAHIRYRYNNNNNIIKIASNKKLKKIKQQNINIETCAICLDTIKNKDKFTTSCNHSYHTLCIKKWAEKKNSCPLCRQDILDELIQKKLKYNSYLLYYENSIRTDINSIINNLMNIEYDFNSIRNDINSIINNYRESIVYDEPYIPYYNSRPYTIDNLPYSYSDIYNDEHRPIDFGDEVD